MGLPSYYREYGTIVVGSRASPLGWLSWHLSQYRLGVAALAVGVLRCGQIMASSAMVVATLICSLDLPYEMLYESLVWHSSQPIA
ncbi:MAG: hypothetical protein Aurels2KO_23530 [Aureliella sp.]